MKITVLVVTIAACGGRPPEPVPVTSNRGAAPTVEPAEVTKSDPCVRSCYEGGDPGPWREDGKSWEAVDPSEKTETCEELCRMPMELDMVRNTPVPPRSGP